jgi:hypothetical protein
MLGARIRRHVTSLLQFSEETIKEIIKHDRALATKTTYNDHVFRTCFCAQIRTKKLIH